MDDIRKAIEGAVEYLTAHTDEARYTDSAATATLEEGLRVRVEGPAGASLTTDMPASVGGQDSAPSAGWAFRASLAACLTTLIAMRAAQTGRSLNGVEVSVDSESDDRGILGIDPEVPAGPLSVRVSARVTTDEDDGAAAHDLLAWALEHCPVADAVRRAVPLSVS